MLPLTRTTATAVLVAALLLAVPLAGAHGASADARAHAADEHGQDHDHDDSEERAANDSDQDDDEADDEAIDPAWAPVEDAQRLAREDQSARAVLFSPTPAREVLVDAYADPANASATVNVSTLAEVTTGNTTLDAALADALAATPAEGLVGTQANATATASAGVDAPEAP